MDNILFQPELLWLTIITLATISGLSALKLSRNIDTLTTHTGLKGGIAGLVILSGVSSLPELVTIITSAVNNEPSLAFSDIIGANALTGVMIAITYIAFRSKASKEKISKSNTLALFIALGIYIIISTSIILLNMDITYPIFDIGVKFGLPLLLAMLAYVAMIFITKEEDDEQVEEDNTSIQKALSKESTVKGMINTNKVILETIMYSVILVAAAIVLTMSASQAASPEGYNLGHGVAGALILATTTSIPEIVSIITLTRLGRRNMAIGGVVGSHVFNFSMLFIGELVYKGTILESIIDSPEAYKQFMGFMVLVIAITIMLLFNFLTPTNKVKNKTIVSYIIVGTFIGAWIFINTAL